MTVLEIQMDAKTEQEMETGSFRGFSRLCNVEA